MWIRRREPVFIPAAALICQGLDHKGHQILHDLCGEKVALSASGRKTGKSYNPSKKDFLSPGLLGKLPLIANNLLI